MEEGRMSIRVVIIGRAIEEPVGIQAGPIETVFEDAQTCRTEKNASGISGSMRRPQRKSFCVEVDLWDAKDEQRWRY